MQPIREGNLSELSHPGDIVLLEGTEVDLAAVAAVYDVSYEPPANGEGPVYRPREDVKVEILDRRTKILEGSVMPFLTAEGVESVRTQVVVPIDANQMAVVLGGLAEMVGGPRLTAKRPTRALQRQAATFLDNVARLDFSDIYTKVYPRMDKTHQVLIEDLNR